MSPQNSFPEQSPLDPDRLYRLLPAYIRQRDLGAGQPLQALLRVIAQQVNAIDLNIAQLYDNLFIETCQDWAAPYIADLIGYKPLRPVLPIGDGRPGDVEADLRLRFVTPRRDVANMLRDRRRKGTADVLQQIAWDVAGWPARLVENIDSMETSVSVQHQELTFGRTLSIKTSTGSPASSQSLGGSRGFSVKSGAGVNDITLNVWRQRSFSVHWSQACACAELTKNCFSFHPLGLVFPLYAALDEELERNDETNANPAPESWQFPGPITRELLTHETDDGGVASDKLYGENKSIVIRCGFWAGLDPAPPAAGEVDRIIPNTQVIPVDLSNWDNHVPQDGTVGLDPETGRLIFPPNQLPMDLRVSFYQGETGPIGGGEYQRGPWSESEQVYTVGQGVDAMLESIAAAIEVCADDAKRHPIGGGAAPILRVIEICDSSVYDEKEFNIRLHAGQRLQIRARNGCRPVIRIREGKSRKSEFHLHGLSDSQITLDGLMFVGGELRITGPIAQVSLVHCTLVPGWDADPSGTPLSRDNPGIVIGDTVGELSIDHCILGPIQVRSGDQKSSPIRIVATDSIVDALPIETVPASSSFAIGAVGPSRAHAIGHFERCTVFGATRIHTIELAENCIFTQRVEVTRVTAGQIRFSWVPSAVADAPRLPPLVMCQPASPTDLPPTFEDVRFWMPGYAALANDCPAQIRHGADDGSELGAFHDLFRSVRLTNLQTRLQEFIPVDTSATVITIT